MKKKNSSKYDYLINEYPAVITKDQFYRICNISKKTAKHLLDNGLVPCVNSGKKTRKYKLKLTDVIVYLEARDVSPENYTAPLGWYKRGSTYKGHKREPRVLTEEERNQLTKFYSHRMAYYPDVLNVIEASEITGYHRNSVAKWCTKKQVQCFNMGNKYLIPKPCLLEFMLSPFFQGLKSKID
ncbi:helix-turn-helix domain-containing protein [Dehalobacterium formicoaceticum]|uniref:Helix-turn-helix domain-containing protein n=1 Tax=Dehalobacterium formicoaceticum TaxID=51515 RepID=A0ABT1Y8E2_9FIRM|nr:helix-turn-helix domain-containing protein [Dehalobacterium formicoaceticum]MCR6547161.1 helix-turn-helix domain-containing protein [Dehalobacterium formicoaceticum]